MAELIIAMDENGGIGNNNKLPWYIPSELQIFKSITLGKTLVFGKNTLLNLPELKERDILCLTRNNNLHHNIEKIKNKYTMIFSLNNNIMLNDNVIIAGGKQVYELALNHENPPYTIHLSIIKGEYNCDTFFDKKLLRNYIIFTEKEYRNFNHYTLKRVNHGEHQYLNLIDNILNNGVVKSCRNGETFSIFKNDMTFDLRNGFPLFTTKKMFMRGILEEFLFFILGKTDTTELSNKNVNIWKGNTSKEFLSQKGLNYSEGIMGPMYGYQWRFFNSPYVLDDNQKPNNTSNEGIDQLSNVIKTIKAEPNSRRILMTVYNPNQVEQGVLYPCHSIIIQFNVDNDFLDMFCYNRSQDVFLGVPFNIASSALLLTIVSKLTSKTPRFCYITMGDTHIYKEHYNVALKQSLRIPYRFPTLVLPNFTTLKDFEDIKASDFVLINYKSHPSIKANMVV